MKREIYILVGLLTVTQILGCATVERSAYLKSDIPFQKGEFVEKYYKDPNFKITDYPEVLIQMDSYDVVNDTKTVDLRSLKDYLKTITRVELKNSGIFEKVSDVEDDAKQISSKKLICTLAITRLDPGSRAMRWMFGELGAGHTHVQVEGKLIDYETGKELFAFADHRAGAAVLDITGGDPTTYIREDITNIVAGLVKTLLAVSRE